MRWYAARQQGQAGASSEAKANASNADRQSLWNAWEQLSTATPLLPLLV